MDIGLVGCGRWGVNILRDLTNLGARVHVVRHDTANDRPIEGAASLHRDPGDLPIVDGYVVATPTSTHAEVALSLLPYGRPIFIEKPMTNSVDAARRLHREGKGRVFVMDKWRYHPGIARLRDAIAGDMIGTPIEMATVRWNSGDSQSDVGPLWTLAPHDLSIVLHCFGRLPPLRSVHNVDPVDLCRSFVVSLADEEGPTVRLDVSSKNERRRRVVVRGTTGQLDLCDEQNDHVVWTGNGPMSSPHRLPFAAEPPLQAELRAFLAFVAGGRAPYSSSEDGLLIVERLAEVEQRLNAQKSHG